MTDLRDGHRDFADHEIPPPSEVERDQLLRALASDAIRGRLAAFRFDAVGGDRHQAFVSSRGQLLNQSPELRNC
jgi:hypothetical protein